MFVKRQRPQLGHETYEGRENEEPPHTPSSRGLRAKRRAMMAADEAECGPSLPTPSSSSSRHKLVLGLVSTPRRARTLASVVSSPLTPPASPMLHSPRSARSAFSRGEASTLVGRVAEREAVQSFVTHAIEHMQGGCMFVSGAPGTGKTATITHVANDLLTEKVKPVVVNCTHLKTPGDIFSTLLLALTGEHVGNSKDAAATLQQVLTSPRQFMHLVILDEIDFLVTRDQEVLYTIFQWSKLPASTLALVGVANALDLTDRVLPRLKSKGIVPSLLSFKTYSAADIANILNARAPSANLSFHPAAIQLCARKVAASTGDIRRALDICRLAVDLAVSEQKNARAREPQQRIVLGELPTETDTNIKQEADQDRQIDRGAGPNTPQRNGQDDTHRDDPVKVSISHIAKVASNLQGSASTQSNRIKQLSLQQKAVLCTLCTKTVRSMATTTCRAIYDVYNGFCQRDQLITALSFSEFVDVVDSLEVVGVVHISSGCGRASTTRKSEMRVALAVPCMDAVTKISDIGVLARFLSE